MLRERERERERESLKKETQQQQVKFQPHIAAQETFAAEPGVFEKTVSRRAKRRIENELQENCLEHSVSLDT